MRRRNRKKYECSTTRIRLRYASTFRGHYRGRFCYRRNSLVNRDQTWGSICTESRTWGSTHTRFSRRGWHWTHAPFPLQELVSVQPMTQPTGHVFFLDYIYSQNEGDAS
jgi:hypothetical protein